MDSIVVRTPAAIGLLFLLFAGPESIFAQTAKNSVNAVTKENSVALDILVPEEDDLGESPRRRRQLLQKRNPMASEHQSVGGVGLSLTADLDAEGVDKRSLFRAGSLFKGNPATLKLEVGNFYNDLSEQSALKVRLSVKKVFGREGNWAFSATAETDGSKLVFEEVSTRWRIQEPDEGQFFLMDRLRINRGSISTRRNKLDAELQYRLSDNHIIYLKSYLEDREDVSSRHRLELRYGSGDVQSIDSTTATITDAKARHLLRFTPGERTVFRFLAGGDKTGDNAWFGYSFYYSDWQRKRNTTAVAFERKGVDMSYSLADPRFPDFSIDNGVDIYDPSQYEFDDIRLDNSITTDIDYAGQVNFGWSYHAFGLDAITRLGAVYRSKERTSTAERLTWEGFDGDYFLNDSAEDVDPGQVVRGVYRIGVGPDAGKTRDFFEANQDRFFFDFDKSRIDTDPSNYRSYETVGSFYLQNTLKNDRLEIQGGLRFELTNTETEGNEVISDDDGKYVSSFPLENTNEYTHLLPSARAVYSFSSDWQLRAEWFASLARPNYFALVPYRRFIRNSQFIFEGNPDLRPTEFSTFLLVADFHNPLPGDLSVGIYYKDIESFFYDSETRILDDPVLEGFELRRPENGGGATVWGMEAGWERPLDFLPQVLGKWRANLYYTYSETEARTSTRSGELLPLPKRSRHLLKAALAGKLGKFNLRLSLDYQSEFLDQIGINFEEDEYIDDSLKFNLSVDYRPDSKWRLYAIFRNLNDEAQREFEGTGFRRSKTEYGSWQLRTGVSLSL